MLISVFFYLFISNDYAWACSRPKLDLAFTAALADQILTGKVIKIIEPDQVEVKVVKQLKGTSGKIVKIKGVYTARTGRFEPCQSVVVKVGSEYTFFLFEKFNAELFQRTVDPNDGVLSENTSSLNEKLLDIIKDHGRSSKWRPASDGLAVRLISKKSRYKAEEDIDLDLVFRNTSTAKLTLKYKTWPPEQHTFCELDILKNTNLIGVGNNPIKQQDIVDYFSKHGTKSDLELDPNQIFHFYLDRINSAKPGWGYKERTGFKYYPLSEGEFAISARCKNFLKNAIQSDDIQIAVEQ